MYYEDPGYGRKSSQEDINTNIYSIEGSGDEASPKEVDREGQVG
jgi:hypothetical protein